MAAVQQQVAEALQEEEEARLAMAASRAEARKQRDIRRRIELQSKREKERVSLNYLDIAITKFNYENTKTSII